MDKDSKEQEEIKDIYSIIERIASSGMEFRRSIERCVFNRLQRLFKTKGTEISMDSKLSELFGKRWLKGKWTELSEIGFRIPELKRSKMFDYVSIGYLIVAFIGSIIFALENLELVFVVWGLPIIAIIWPLLFSPILLFIVIFPKKYLPAQTIEELVDQIVSRNWTKLIEDDKAMFHQVMREEMERDQEGQRTTKSSISHYRVV